ncbi:MAG: hypothetical protein DRQ88_01045 [Epsilonproteobacteria bacterium]|nr:MAG: hypothetical protein DRQ89_05110 [Campylobacterota bacterium]RLA67880.1 MAG: hypothetical protein DRQ88_01045 [Campylobacterota bacterium]
MKLENLYKEIGGFSKENQGSSNYYNEDFYVQGPKALEFAPLSLLKKKFASLNSPSELLELGFVYQSIDFFGSDSFVKWYEKKFARKLSTATSNKMTILKIPNNKSIFDSIENIDKAYKNLRANKILLNGKNLPVQLGEWYARIIFGLYQKKSSSQRGFDFKLDDRSVEIKVHWADSSSPKGVKIRRSLVQLSDYCIIIYIHNNFMIREICFLDSKFITRKFTEKGHTIFLKDSQVSNYFFSKSSKHDDKVINRTALMKYSSPQFAIKIADRFQ